MEMIHHEYWHVFQSIFIFIGIGMTLLLVKSFFYRDSVTWLNTILELVCSASMLLSLFNATFFLGLLYDEFNLPLDLILTVLPFYGLFIFVIHCGLLFYRHFKKYQGKKS